MNITDHVFEETHIAGQSRCVAETLTDVLRDLSVANKQKARLTMRRIGLLIETGDTAVMDLIDKLCKIKLVKATN